MTSSTNTGERLGREALRWDAGYCALGGAAAVLFSAPLSSHLDLAAWLVAVAGIAVVGWAVLVWWLARAPGWRPAVTGVATANVVAAAGLAVWAVAQSGPAGAVLGLVALQVGTFAVIQAAALLRAAGRR